jgi:phosphohistidine phosphatase
VTLYVLRHGVAEDTSPEGDDGSRRLTPGGRRKIYAEARGMWALGLRFDLILTSPLARAAETAAILSDVYGGDPAPRDFPPLAQGVPPVETVRALRPYARHEHVVIVGHEPGLSGVVSFVLTGSPDGFRLALKKGGLVAVEAHDLGRRAGATLLWMLAPRQLRGLRKL